MPFSSPSTVNSFAFGARSIDPPGICRSRTGRTASGLSELTRALSEKRLAAMLLTRGQFPAEYVPRWYRGTRESLAVPTSRKQDGHGHRGNESVIDPLVGRNHDRARIAIPKN